MLELVFALTVHCSLLTENFHASAWRGHFSAQNFSQTEDKKALLGHRRTIAKAMRALPENHVKSLKHLEIKNRPHRSRGMANHKKMILHTGKIETKDELMSVFIHEMGHIVDLGHLKGQKGYRTKFKDGKRAIFSDDASVKFYQISWLNSKNRRRGASRKDFVSGYAMSDPFEDFAESYLFYRVHGDKFRKISKHSVPLRRKYNFLRTQVFDHQEFQIKKDDPKFTHEKLWDATLLPIDNL